MERFQRTWSEGYLTVQAPQQSADSQSTISHLCIKYKKLFHFLTISRSTYLCLLFEQTCQVFAPVLHSVVTVLPWKALRAENCHGNRPSSVLNLLLLCWNFSYDCWKRKNLKSAIYEQLVFFLVMFTCQHISIYLKYVSRTVVYLQGRGIFMSGQNQNRRAMSRTERGWWVSELITDWISGLKAKDSSWEHVCNSQAESDRSCLEGMWCIWGIQFCNDHADNHSLPFKPQTRAYNHLRHFMPVRFILVPSFKNITQLL